MDAPDPPGKGVPKGQGAGASSSVILLQDLAICSGDAQDAEVDQVIDGAWNQVHDAYVKSLMITDQWFWNTWLGHGRHC